MNNESINTRSYVDPLVVCNDRVPIVGKLSSFQILSLFRVRTSNPSRSQIFHYFCLIQEVFVSPGQYTNERLSAWTANCNANWWAKFDRLSKKMLGIRRRSRRISWLDRSYLKVSRSGLFSRIAVGSAGDEGVDVWGVFTTRDVLHCLLKCSLSKCTLPSSVMRQLHNFCPNYPDE